MSNVTRSFRYEALPSESAIRLLTVKPLNDKEAFNDVLHCSTITVEPDARTRYNCLSYTWGHPLGGESSQGNTGAQLRYSILLDGSDVKVGANLYNGLIQISKSLGHNLNPMWVDAVCINQQDVAECTKQVRLMRRIYSEASDVFAWLGQASTEQLLAVLAIKTLARVLPERNQATKKRPTGEDVYKYLGIPPITDSEHDAIRHFYERTWFRQIWVIQEAVLANKLRFYFAPECMTSHDIFNATNAIYELSDDFHYPSGKDGILSRTMSLPGYAYDISLNSLVMSATLHIIDLIDKRKRIDAWYIFDNHIRLIGRWQKPTDPRDYIYGMLGLMPGLDGVSPDYNKSSEQVFTEITRYML